jgi:hypothetical protein
VTAITVNVVEVNRQRLVSLEGVALALAAAIDAGERDADGHTTIDGGALALEPVRQLRRALSALLMQPLPEGRYPETAGQDVELVAPAHELEQLADELEQLHRSGRFDDEHDPLGEQLEQLVDRLRVRARSRSAPAPLGS